MSNRGRPTKLTPETQGKIVGAIARGNYYEVACRAGNVSYKVFREWMIKGEKAKSGKFRDFRDAVQHAEAMAELLALDEWRKQMPNSWQASRDFLARRHPQRWMPMERQEISGKDGGAIEVVVSWDSVDGSED